MPTVPDSHRDLVASPLVASLATVGADGTPQLTATWFVADGDAIQISVISARQKYKNIVAHPQATLFIIDPKNPFRTLEIRGTAAVAPDPGLETFAKDFRHYGHDPATSSVPREARATITLVPTRVVAQG